MTRSYWLMKSEPDVFGWDDLVRDGKGYWDGVRSHAAAVHLKAMKPGDHALFYHSNIGLEAVGIMEIAGPPETDRTDESGKWTAVHVKPVRPLAHPVTLKAMKAEAKLAEMTMLRQSRLSVAPVTVAQWKTIIAMSETDSRA